MRVFRFTILFCLITASVFADDVRITFVDGDAAWKRMAQNYTRSVRNPEDSLPLFLTEQGFLDNEITASQEKDLKTLNVRFGRRYLIGAIFIEGDRADTFNVNQPFSNDIINDSMNEYLRRYQNGGRYYASMVPVRFEKHDGEIDIYMRLAEGPVVHISEIELVGLKRTDKDFIKKLTGINRGDIISANKIEKSQDNFRSLEFVGLTGSPEIIPNAGYETVRVRYNLMEKQQFYFEGAAGYIPEDDGYYVWYLDLRGRNLFGRGQKAGLLADSREKDKSIFRVYYGQPLLILGMGNVLMSVRIRDYRDQFYEFGVTAAYELA
ncbi:MAG: POTRA domain-containing protein, partial [Candidatus Zixiibacteriota bacterium]